MPKAVGLFADDEELGKKNDDHRPNGGSKMASLLPSLRGPRKRRFILGLLALWIVYIFIKNIPTDLPPVSERTDRRFPLSPPRPGTLPSQPQGPRGAPPRVAASEAEKHYYDGPIKFFELARTLQTLRAHSESDDNNVLFAASNLQSVSSLLPMACEMSIQGRNRVHFVLLGREAIPIEDIKEVNGIDEKECLIYFHDGRPDYAPWSSDFRMGVSTRAALGHAHTFLRPQVLLTDNSEREDEFFSKSIGDKAQALNLPAIELPSFTDNVMWMAKLDSSSLRAWNHVRFDILVHAPPESSGSLIRLIKSLENADYFGSSLPHLTIELPNKVDVPTLMFLDGLRWPKRAIHDPGDGKLTLRHRINPKGLSAAESSVRTVESFYPATGPMSHVLVLSPQAELSPSYFHYLKYAALEYKHSIGGFINADKLLGVSLDLPLTQLNGHQSFEPPGSVPAESVAGKQAASISNLFLWQAPNSNAALYFGDKWIELHSFLSNRFAAQQHYKKAPTRPKLVSEAHPAWMEYLLELTRARGYSMIYPSFAARPDSSVVTLHNELYHPPEEFSHEVEPDAIVNVEDQILNEPFTADRAAEQLPPPAVEPHLASAPSILTLMDLTSPGDSLPHVAHLALLDFEGEQITFETSNTMARAYSNEFSIQVGGCDRLDQRGMMQLWSTDDLFCLNGDIRDHKLGSAQSEPKERDAISLGGGRVPIADESIAKMANPGLRVVDGKLEEPTSVSSAVLLPTGMLEATSVR